MKNIICLTFFLITLSSIGQNQGILKRIFEIGKPIVFKSEFNNHHYRFKDGNELISPSYTTTYFFFDNSTLAIYNPSTLYFDEVYVLDKLKEVKRDSKRLVYFHKSNITIFIDFEKSVIKVSFPKELADTDALFEDFTIPLDEEATKAINIFFGK